MGSDIKIKGRITPFLAQTAIDMLEGLPHDESYTVEIRKFKKDRSAAQRRLQHVWYTYIFMNQPGAEDKQNSKKYIENYCKLEFGVPILFRDDENFAKSWSAMSMHMTYQEQLDAMSILQVTRLFKVKQNTEYLEEMKRHYSEKEDSVYLPSGDDLYYEAMGYKR